MTNGVEQLTLTTPDATPITVLRYEPDEPSDLAALIVPDLGFGQASYKYYAEFLAAAGITTWSFDFRGVARSRDYHRRLRANPASLRQWFAQDLFTVQQAFIAATPDTRRVYIGHGFSGFLLGMTDYADFFAAFVGIATANPNGRYFPLGQRILRWDRHQLTLPLVVALFGCIPEKMLGNPHPIPPRVGFDYARAARKRFNVLDQYGETTNHFAEFRGPALVYSLEDDKNAPPQAIDGLLNLYPNAAPIQRELIRPADLGREIGHVGFFTPGSEQLWRHSLDFMQKALATTPAEPAGNATSEGEAMTAV